MIGQPETLEGLDEAIDTGLFEVKLRLKDNGSENINAICTDYVGKANKSVKNKKNCQICCYFARESSP